MSDASRNAPCPCGSGKKYKRCCGAPRPPSPAGTKAAEAHLLDGELVKQIYKHGLRRFPDAGSPDVVFRMDVGGDPEDLPFFIPWTVYHWLVNGRPLVAWFLEERASKLSPTERAWLEAQSRAWISIWEAASIAPGRSMDLVDLLTGESRHVREKSGSRMLTKGASVLCRVVDFEGVSVIAGTREIPLPPDRVPGLLVRACEALGAPMGKVPIERLREPDAIKTLVSLWEAEVDELMGETGPPQLQNTDGDPLRLTTDTFEIRKGSREEVMARLSALEGVERDQEADQPTLVFTHASNTMSMAAGPTVIGRVIFAEGSLSVETNSTRRADNLRARLEGACAGLVLYQRRTHKETEALWNEARSSPRRPEKPPPPEAVAFMRDFKVKHYEAWIDESIPALGGATPREAARSPLAREMLIQLVKEMEHMEARTPKEQRYDYSILRKKLGLE